MLYQCFDSCFINALLKFDVALDRAKIHRLKKYFNLFVVLLVGCLVLRNLFCRFVWKDLNNGNYDTHSRNQKQPLLEGKQLY